MGGVSPLEHDTAAIASDAAADQVEQCGFPGAIRSDDGHELASPDLESNLIDHRSATEPLRDVLDKEKGVVVHFRHLESIRATSESRPPGRESATMMITMPRQLSQ